MDDSPSGFASLTDWMQSLSETQRRLLPIGAAAALLAAIWFATNRAPSDSILPLNSGVTPAAAIAHLHERGLSAAHLNDAGQVVVAPRDVAVATTWLQNLDASASTWADEWEKSNSQLGQFSGSRERDTAREITRARVIGRLLRQMPGVAQADVIWDEEESAGWRQPQRTRCTVYLRPKSGFEITPDVARSVRQAVAGSKKNLAPGDIVVMDLARMTTFDAVPAGVDDTQRMTAERQVAQIRRDIEAELDACQDVRVNVGVSWNAIDADETAVTFSPTSATSSSHPQTALNWNPETKSPWIRETSSTAIGEFEPTYQITVTASEESAAKWVDGVADANRTPSRDERVTPASFETAMQMPRANSAAASIRHHVASVLKRHGRSNIPAAVAVHLIPTAKAMTPSLGQIAHAAPIEPAMFIGIAAAACLCGAWLLSKIFQGSTRQEFSYAAGADLPSTATPGDYGSTANWSRGIATDFTSEPMDFEDLIHHPAEVWAHIWHLVSLEDWVAALKGSSQQLRRKVLEGLDASTADHLQETLESSAPPRLSEIDDSQRRILEAVRREMAT